MAVVALGIYVVWIGSVFVVPAALARRRGIDSGFRGFPGGPTSVAWWSGVLFALALVVGLAAPLAHLAGLAPLVEAPLLGAVGALVAVAGVGASLAGRRSMGSSWRVGVDDGELTDLVASGPFGVVRNPFFTATVATAVGLAAMVLNVVSLVAVLALVTAVELQVRCVEEPHLRRLHGERYERYAARVGRFVPAVGRRRP